VTARRPLGVTYRKDGRTVGILYSRNNVPETQTTLVYVVRHGETEWNLISKQQGHLDSPLTERGIEQAHALAAGLRDRGVELVFSSDLGRAMATADIICKRLGLSARKDMRLRERHLGSLQGLTKDEWRMKYPDEWMAFNSGDPDYCFPGGESARQRFERSVGCVEELAIQHCRRIILIVAHGGVLSGLFYRATGVPLDVPRRFSLFNAAINSFTVSGTNWRLDTWGEVCHLRGMATLDDQ
jgi:2,3-bisphosphoglycerate-dependent phosphoglycerate mutase